MVEVTLIGLSSIASTNQLQRSPWSWRVNKSRLLMKANIVYNAFLLDPLLASIYMIKINIERVIWSLNTLLFADGNGGMKPGSCPNRAESSPMNTKSRSLVLMNYFPDNPDVTQACKHNSAPLISMINTCHDAAGKRWPNFITVDFYKVLMIL